MRKLLMSLIVVLGERESRGLRLQQAAEPGRGGESRLVRSREPVPAARGSDSEPRRHGEGFRRAGRARAGRRDRGARQGDVHPAHARAHQQPGGVREIPGGAGRAHAGAEEPARVTESYPELKSDANFRDLQAQLEGTENRITVARNRYIEAVQAFNVTVREFPTNLTAGMFDFEVKPNFTVENEAAISTAPAVTFDTSTPSQSATPVEAARPPRRRRRTERREVKAALLVAGAAAAPGTRPRRSAQIPLPRARGARHRSHRHAHRRAAVRARGEARRVRGAQGRADRGADPADDGARGHRAIRRAAARGLEARPQGHRRRRHPHRRQGRSRHAHRSAVRPRRRAHRRDRAAASSTTRSCRCSSRAISPAASTPASTRCSAWSTASRCRRPTRAGNPGSAARPLPIPADRGLVIAHRPAHAHRARLRPR